MKSVELVEQEQLVELQRVEGQLGLVELELELGLQIMIIEFVKIIEFMVT